jgi:DNA modification methylase
MENNTEVTKVTGKVKGAGKDPTKAPEKSKADETILSLDPKTVYRGNRIRSDIGAVEDLAASIKEVGQLHPIVVRKDSRQNRYNLVAGDRRLRACEMLGREVQAKAVLPRDELHELLMQIHENSKRKGFDAVEQYEAIQRGKRLYERDHPETVHGAAGHGRPKKVAKTATLKGAPKPPEPAPRYTQVAAKATGYSERRIYEFLEIANLPEAMKKDIRAAKTTAERDRVIQECLKKVRAEKRRKDLEKAAEQRRQQDLSDAGKPKKPSVILHFGDNKAYFKGEEIYELVLTDPPYDRERSLIGHIARASIGKTLAWDKLDLAWVMRTAPMLTKGGQILAFCPLEAIGAYELAFKAAELEYRGAIIWHKTNAGTVYRSAYLPACEAIVWASKPGAKYTFATWEEQAGGLAHNIISGPICQGNERLGHETQKPEWLVERLLKRHTVAGQRVFDPFAGVATTLAVCKRLGLYAVGVEKEEEYIRSAKSRLAAIR